MTPQIIHFNRVWNHYFHHPFWDTPIFRFNTQLLLFNRVQPVASVNLPFRNSSLKSFPWSTHVSTIWYGSSFLRELYLEAARLNHNIQTRQNCQLPRWAQKEEQKRQIQVNGRVNVSIFPPICRLSSQDWHTMDMTFPATDDATCLPPQYAQTLGSMSSCKFTNLLWKHKCKSWMGLEGIDLNLCGAPGFRESPDMHLAIGFKTVLHSPRAEELFLRSLEKANLSNDKANQMGSLDISSIAIVELGTAWGPRGKRQAISEMGLPTLTLKEEIQYYVHWVHAVAFPHHLVLWISACGCSQGGIADKRQLIQDMWSEVQSHYKHTAVLIDKCVS